MPHSAHGSDATSRRYGSDRMGASFGRLTTTSPDGAITPRPVPGVGTERTRGSVWCLKPDLRILLRPKFHKVLASVNAAQPGIQKHMINYRYAQLRHRCNLPYGEPI